jgi:quinol-cytochrome oxidoreductase complex cytochrome b subunit
VRPFTRALDGWVSYQSNPGWFVGSVVAYVLAIAVFLGLLLAWLFEHRRLGRWRARQHFDSTIRQAPDER